MTQPLPFEFPSIVTVSPPMIPQLVMAPPIAGDTVTVLPVVGPKGDTGGTGEMGYVYSSSAPAMVHQIRHNLTFKPGGITCLDTDGSSLLGFSVSHPMLGITEVSFGVAVTPTVYLS